MAKSNEYDIRLAVVKSLMEIGIDRGSIRIEIPLDTASSGGRADILVLTHLLTCIELKSGKDKYDHTGINKQLSQYHRPFDGTVLIVDDVHRKEIVNKKDERITSWSNNWGPVNIGYNHAEGKLTNTISDWGLQHYIAKDGWRTSVIDVCSLLWVSEIREQFGWKRSKQEFIRHMRENARLCDVRPKVIAALRSRPLNLWEKKFWNTYDGIKEPDAQLECELNSNTEGK